MRKKKKNEEKRESQRKFEEEMAHKVKSLKDAPLPREETTRQDADGEDLPPAELDQKEKIPEKEQKLEEWF